MPAPWPADRTERLRRLIHEPPHMNDAEAAQEMGLTYQQVREKRRAEGWPSGHSLRVVERKQGVIPAAPPPPPPPEEFSREGKADTQHLSSKSTRIKTLEDLLAHADVDTDVWEVERYVVNKWEVGCRVDGEIATEPLFQVKAWLRRNKEAARLVALKDAALQEIREHAPRFPAYRPVLIPAGAPRYMLEVCIFDPHFGKYAWSDETGEDYDLRIAEARFMWALERLLQKASHNAIEQIVIPIGQDAIHADSSENATTRGTRQDVDSRWFKVFQVACRVYRRALERCAEVAPTIGIVVPGNHGRHSELALGEVMDAHFTHSDRVQIIGGPRERKYHPYGANLIGYTHGDTVKGEKLAGLMPVEEPHLWAASRFREFHVGHWHKAKEVNWIGLDEYNGTRVRVIPSLSGTDAWHAANGYTHSWKAAQAFLWNHDDGLEDTYAANLGPYPQADEMNAAA